MYLCWEFTRKGVASQAVRIGDFKIIRNDGINSPVEVYNLKSDPQEQNNIAESVPDMVAKGERIFKKAHVDNRLYPIKK